MGCLGDVCRGHHGAPYGQVNNIYLEVFIHDNGQNIMRKAVDSVSQHFKGYIYIYIYIYIYCCTIFVVKLSHVCIL